ncbi:hypothetical protein SAMN05444920_1488 [Nonomuraea solani]|uniref:Uncharacterized protein n=1 Tax=Nonomuraea solani TaxID=1144553 RepID=A0A1H6F197_9ACTN|nr:hypothetical protein [Nonomuraea solani]SEH03917.1 hypothetical protein SAMN05444920_1488 [Nonomuraea solani]
MVATDRVRAALNELEREVHPSLVQAVETLRSAASAEGYPPDTLLTIIAGLRECNAMMARGEGIGTIIRAVGDDDLPVFRQRYESVDQVVNAKNYIVNQLQDLPGLSGQSETIVRIPLILLAMTERQAAELRSGEVFNEYPASLRDDFRQACVLLEQEAVADWFQCYGERPEDWRPFSAGSDSIQTLVHRIIEQINERKRYDGRLEPEFLDIHEVIGDRHQLLRLRRSGCIVIIDVLSLRHPQIQRAYHQSLLDAYPNTSIVTIAPVAKALEKARELTVFLQLRIADLEFAKRRSEFTSSARRCIETWEQNMLEGWLEAGFHDTAIDSGLKEGIRKHMRYVSPYGGSG